MRGQPLLSFIVLSYNYETYIGQTIRSILDQTVQDFEVVVVDDASSDASREVVSAFNDPRIRMLVNERNLGGAGSYNRAVSAARGDWLVNLDADDWIAPEKSLVQLNALAANPGVDILGTYVSFVDADGNPYGRREELEAFTNHDRDLNRIDNWVGRSTLCRSSTMVRRTAHLAIGLDDPTMTRAPDYELWTRALRFGCRIAVVPALLTYCRVHARGVTHGDHRVTFLELCYAMSRNLLPLIEARSFWPSFSAILDWIAGHEELAGLTPGERYRLLGSMLIQPQVADYSAFLTGLQATDADNLIANVGRRCLAILRSNPLRPMLNKLESDNLAFVGARDWWHDQADRWEAESIDWRSRFAALEARTAERQFVLDELQTRLAEAERKLRWTPSRVGRAALSRFFRSS